MLWHTKEERPEGDRRIFCLLGEKQGGSKETIRTVNTKGITYAMYNVEKWCYVDELLEKTKEM